MKRYLSNLRKKVATTFADKNDLSAGKSLRYEVLETRSMLSAAGIIDSVAQPSGALDGKIVFTSAGHGLEYNGNVNTFYAGREEFASTEVNEAFGNQDQLYFFAEHLLRAGATVVPMRPIGDQPNEVVLDNDSPGVTFSGSWSNSSSNTHYDEDYGAVADSVSYRFSSISATETATATYTPNIPEAGFYPVYTWVFDSGNRTNQLYRINDSAGGVTEIRVDHRKVGKGWVYLGTYHFDSGSSGNVQISNQSTDGGAVVIADAIRFGNGMGDLPDGPGGLGTGSTSGAPREDEASIFWIYRGIGQGVNISSVIGTGNVSAPENMAHYMNNNANAFGDSVYIGFHSNAGGSRGAVGLYTNSAAQRTPNQELLATYTGRQINQDMQALNGQFEHNWSTRTSHTYNGINFGEINAGPGAEMDMTIIEVAFHDDNLDADLLTDPKVREQLGRSTYEAVIEYFTNHAGLADSTSQPSAPTEVSATTAANGDITVSWDPGPIGVQGGTPTAFRVYASRDGYGYAGYVEVAGAGAGSYTFDSADLDENPYYFKVVAVNSGGESPRSLVVAAQKSTAPAAKRVLILQAFDRNDRSLNERYSDPFSNDPDGLDLVDRVRPRYNNTFDYSIQVAEAIAANPNSLRIDTASNEELLAGDVTLSDYDAVFWTSGEESSADDTFNATEQSLVETYLTGGGKLFVSGAEIGWDLDNLNNGRDFYNDFLRADYVSDDAATYNVQGAAGSIFAGLSFSFDDGDLFYDVNFPDRINPLGGATSALNYVGGLGGNAAIQYDSGASTKVVNFGFPFETITSEANRGLVMERVLEFFELDVVANADFDGSGNVTGLDFLAWQVGNGISGGATLADGDADGDGNVGAADLAIWDAQYGSTTQAAAIQAPLASSSAITAQPEQPGFAEESHTSIAASVDAGSLAGAAQRFTLQPLDSSSEDPTERILTPVGNRAEDGGPSSPAETPASPLDRDEQSSLHSSEEEQDAAARQEAFTELEDGIGGFRPL